MRELENLGNFVESVDRNRVLKKTETQLRRLNLCKFVCYGQVSAFYSVSVDFFCRFPKKVRFF